jgi:plastocyanin
MRLGMRCLVGAVVTAVLFASLSAVGSSTEPSPTVEAVNFSTYSHYWSPEHVAVSTGATITVRNMTTTAHGVEWVGGPVIPGCSSGVKVGTTPAASGKEWSGTCTFSQTGTYTFYCTVHGPEMTETVTVTTPGAPTATTGTANSVGEMTATLNGTVNPQGKASNYHFDYGTTTSYGKETAEESAGAGSTNETVAIPVSSLAPGTIYHFKLMAKNAAGTTEGVDRTFTTLSPPGPPIATTGSASALGEAQATLNGTVNPNGEATGYFFEWGTSGAYGHSTKELPAGEDHTSHAEAATLTGLAAGTVYHFRVVAKNASSTTPGLDQTFTTTSAPAPEKTTTTTSAPPPVTPGPSATTSTTPVVTPAPGPPIVGSPLLRAAQHGASVTGSLDVSADGAGGRLEIEVFAKGAAITRAKRSSSVLVGRVVRGSVSAGTVKFSIKLDAKARSALRRHRSLVLSVRITLTPRVGRSTSVTRSVVLR